MPIIRLSEYTGTRGPVRNDLSGSGRTLADASSVQSPEMPRDPSLKAADLSKHQNGTFKKQPGENSTTTAPASEPHGSVQPAADREPVVKDSPVVEGVAQDSQRKMALKRDELNQRFEKKLEVTGGIVGIRFKVEISTELTHTQTFQDQVVVSDGVVGWSFGQ